MIPFFHLLFKPYLLLHSTYAFQDRQNSVLCGPSFASCSGLLNTYLQTRDDTIKPVNISILLVHNIANFWYILMFQFQFHELITSPSDCFCIFNFLVLFFYFRFNFQFTIFYCSVFKFYISFSNSIKLFFAFRNLFPCVLFKYFVSIFSFII